MKDILTAQHQATVNPTSASKLYYMVEHLSSFDVLPDAETVIGVNGQLLRYLQAENFTSKRANRKLSNIKDLRISTVTYNAQNDLLLAADTAGNMTAFRVSLRKLSATRSKLDLGPTSKAHKYHAQLPQQSVYASHSLGDLIVLAGDGVVVISASSGQLVARLARTAVLEIKSVQLCLMPDKVVLAIGGCSSDYSGCETDAFDVTELVRRFGTRESTSLLSIILQAYAHQRENGDSMGSIQDQSELKIHKCNMQSE